MQSVSQVSVTKISRSVVRSNLPEKTKNVRKMKTLINIFQFSLCVERLSWRILNRQVLQRETKSQLVVVKSCNVSNFGVIWSYCRRLFCSDTHCVGVENYIPKFKITAGTWILQETPSPWFTHLTSQSSSDVVQNFCANFSLSTKWQPWCPLSVFSKNNHKTDLRLSNKHNFIHVFFCVQKYRVSWRDTHRTHLSTCWSVQDSFLRCGNRKHWETLLSTFGNFSRDRRAETSAWKNGGATGADNTTHRTRKQGTTAVLENNRHQQKVLSLPSNTTAAAVQFPPPHQTISFQKTWFSKFNSQFLSFHISPNFLSKLVILALLGTQTEWVHPIPTQRRHLTLWTSQFSPLLCKQASTSNNMLGKNLPLPDSTDLSHSFGFSITQSGINARCCWWPSVKSPDEWTGK